MTFADRNPSSTLISSICARNVTRSETSGGARVWFGRHVDQFHIAPAVEYDISGNTSAGRKLNTAVCAAFYDTAVSFSPNTRGTFSTKPPPVICAMPLTSMLSIKASNGLT